MPKAIPVAVITNEFGTHLEQMLPALAGIEEVETVAFVDPSGSKVAEARKALGNKLREVHKNSADMLARFRPVLALVSLEPRLSPPAINAALDADCHVLSEKPGCLSAEDFAPLVKKAQSKHRQVMLIMANRTHAPVQERAASSARDCWAGFTASRSTSSPIKLG
jgi:predicted dehydrogenase